MKKILFPLLLVFVLTSAFKIEGGKTGTLVRDCTGTYIRYKDKDYHVCNAEMLSPFENGDKMIVTFKKVKKCVARENDIVCMMYHENAGWIEIKKILN